MIINGWRERDSPHNIITISMNTEQLYQISYDSESLLNTYLHIF